MRLVPFLCVSMIAAAAQAGVTGGFQEYNDSTMDLFDNDGLSNLDISSAFVMDDGTNITFGVDTRSFQNWTKYMVFIDTGAGGTTSNAWSRPINLTSEIDYFIGSWVDQAANNSQLVAWDGGASAWNWGSAQTFSNQSQGSIQMWTVSLASLGLSGGETIYFDIATSGGGNDPGVDHLSVVGAQATTGWGSPSTSNGFLAYHVSGVPTPGAIALLGLAGLVGRRRR